MYTFNVLCNVYFTQYHLNKFRIFSLSSGRSFSILLDFSVYTDSVTLQITYVTGIYPKDVISCCPLGKLLFSLHKNHFYFVVRINRRFVECLLYIPGSLLLCSYISSFNKINLAFICSWWLFHYLISFFR